MRKTDSRGNVAVIAIACVALVTIASFGIRYLATEKHDTQPSTVTQSTSKTASTNNNPPTDPSEGGKYLVIKEWGVRFKLPNQLRGDVKYGFFTFADGSQAIYFASKALVAKSDGQCDLEESSELSGNGLSGGQLALGRSKDKNSISQTDPFKVGDYWYSSEPSNGGACFVGDTGQWKSDFNMPLENAIKQLEPISQ